MSVIMPCTEDILERLEPSVDECPFCHRDPFHYVDIGVGMDRAAVNCCDLGVSLIQDQDEQLASIVQLHRDAAAHIRDLTASRDRASDACASVQKERDELREMLGRLLNARALSSVRELVAGWNGEHRPDGPYIERHPSRLGARIETNCGRIYELDEIMQEARTFLARYEGGR